METITRPSTKTSVNFVAMEFQQANDHPGSICAVGLTVVEKGKIVASQRRLVRPYSLVTRFDEDQSLFHGIGREAVESAPLLHEVLKEVYSLSKNSRLVVFGAKRKAEMLEGAFESAQLVPRNIHLRCLSEMAMRSEELKSKTLNSLARALVSVTVDVPSDPLKEAELYLEASMTQKTRTPTTLARAMSMKAPFEGDVASESLAVAELYLALFEDEEYCMQFDCAIFGGTDKRRNKVSLQTIFRDENIFFDAH